MDSIVMFQEPKWKCNCDGKDKNDWIVEIFEDKAKVTCNWCGKVVAEPDIFINKNAQFGMVKKASDFGNDFIFGKNDNDSMEI